jgi:hypothetical protein
MKQKLGVYFWVRVAVMCAALVGVVLIMFKLNTPDAAEFNLCPTRVTSIALIGETAVIQDGMTWYRLESGQRKELDQVAVEKWFSAHCKIAIQAVSGQAPQETHPWATIAFVSGSPVTLQRADSVFTFDGRYFHSAQLVQAMTELKALPEAKKPGEH